MSEGPDIILAILFLLSAFAGGYLAWEMSKARFWDLTALSVVLTAVSIFGFVCILAAIIEAPR